MASKARAGPHPVQIGCMAFSINRPAYIAMYNGGYTTQAASQLTVQPWTVMSATAFLLMELADDVLANG